jgi:hypothetical protein
VHSTPSTTRKCRTKSVPIGWWKRLIYFSQTERTQLYRPMEQKWLPRHEFLGMKKWGHRSARAMSPGGSGGRQRVREGGGHLWRISSRGRRGKERRFRWRMQAGRGRMAGRSRNSCREWRAGNEAACAEEQRRGPLKRQKLEVKEDLATLTMVKFTQSSNGKNCEALRGDR